LDAPVELYNCYNYTSAVKAWSAWRLDYLTTNQTAVGQFARTDK